MPLERAYGAITVPKEKNQKFFGNYRLYRLNGQISIDSGGMKATKQEKEDYFHQIIQEKCNILHGV